MVPEPAAAHRNPGGDSVTGRLGQFANANDRPLRGRRRFTSGAASRATATIAQMAQVLKPWRDPESAPAPDTARSRACTGRAGGEARRPPRGKIRDSKGSIHGSEARWFPRQTRTVFLAGLVLLVCLASSVRVSAQEPGPEPEGSVPFTRDDVNADGRRSISNAVMVERYLFFGDRAPPCFDAANANDDGDIDIIDTITILNHLFDNGSVHPEAIDAERAGSDSGLARLRGLCGAGVRQIADEVVSLGAVLAPPGSETSIPVRVTNEFPVEALQLVIRYDPSVFTPGERIGFDGTFYETLLRQGGFNKVTAYPAEGILTVASWLTSSARATAGPSRHGSPSVSKIPGMISGTAEPRDGSATRAPDGPEGGGFGPERLLNELTHTGDARYLSTLPELEGAMAAGSSATRPSS